MRLMGLVRLLQRLGMKKGENTVEAWRRTAVYWASLILWSDIGIDKGRSLCVYP